MTRAGASELTRIPQGARKSAAASVIPRTQAIERIERQSGRIISQLLPPFHLPPHPFIKRKDPKLTLRRPISQTPSRRRMPNNARQVNNTSSFFHHSFVESIQGGVLRVDSVGDEGVDEEGSVGVHFEDGFEVLQIGIGIQYARGKGGGRGMNEESQYPRLVGASPFSTGPTFNLSDILFVQGTFGFVAAQCTAPKSDPLGMTFNISCKEASRTSREVMSVLE
jgi:hypothetical protein